MHKVLHGFWMRGDFFIVITSDKKNNSYYLEMYRYNSKERLDLRFMFMSKEHVTFDICHCASRRYASIYVEEHKVQEQRICKMTLFLLDSQRFKVSEELSLGLGKSFHFGQGVRTIHDKQIPTRRGASKGRIF